MQTGRAHLRTHLLLRSRATMVLRTLRMCANLSQDGHAGLLVCPLGAGCQTVISAAETTPSGALVTRSVQHKKGDVDAYRCAFAVSLGFVGFVESGQPGTAVFSQ